MKRLTRPAAAVLLGGRRGARPRSVRRLVELVELVEQSSSTAASSGGKQGGTITIVSGTPPLSADQGLDFTTQGNELESVVNLPLLTFVRGVQGAAGSKIIPALAQGTADRLQRQQDLHVRPALRACTTPTGRRSRPATSSTRCSGTSRSRGRPLRSSAPTSRAATRTPRARRRTISGIVTDDATGTVKITLVAPFSPIVDIMALPGTAPVPPNTPMKNLAATGTIGDGQYKWGAITPGTQYTLGPEPEVRHPRAAARARGQDRLQRQLQRPRERRAGAQQPGRRVRSGRHAAGVDPAAGQDAGRGPLPGDPAELELVLLVQRS